MNSPETLQHLLARHALEQARDAATHLRFGEAERSLEELRQLDPESHHVPLMRAKLRLREGRLAECREALAEARRLGHDPAENARMLEWLEQYAAQRELIAKDAGDRRQPVPASAARAPRLRYLGTTRDALSTVAALREHLHSHPGCPVGHGRMAEAIAAKAMHWGGSPRLLAEAEAHAQRAMSIAPELADGYAGLGIVLELEGSSLDAERWLRKAIERDPTHWSAHQTLGTMLGQQGRHEAALHLLTAAIELRPTFIPTYDALYQARVGLGDSSGAVDVASEGVSRARTRIESEGADLLALAYLPLLLARSGDQEAARQAVDVLTGRFTKSGSAWAHAALTHAVLGDAQGAIDALQTASRRGFHVSLVTRRAELDEVRWRLQTS